MKQQIQQPQKTQLLVVQGWFIWAIAALFYFYDQLLSVSPGAMKPELSAEFVRNAMEFGSLASYFHIAYGVMQIPVGLLMDKYGPRRLLTAACLFTVCGSLLFSVATTLFEAKMGRVLTGVGAAFAVVGCLKIASLWFPARRFALLTGMMVTVGFLGPVFCLNTVSQAVDTYSWRVVMQFAAAVGGVLTIALWLIVRDHPSQHIPQVMDIEDNHMSLFESLKKVCQCRQTWVASIFASLMFVPTLALGAAWGIPFLAEAHGYDRGQAGTVLSSIYWGWILGAPIFGWVSDHLGRRNLPMMLAAMATLIITLFIVYGNDYPIKVMIGLLFSLGFFSSSFIIAFAVVRESNHPEISGTAIGFINALNTFGGALVQPLVGRMLDLSGPSELSNTGEAIFSLGQYQSALISLPICIGVALIMLFFLKETYCTPAKH